MSNYLKEKLMCKVLYMVLAGVGLIILGNLWDLVFPINKYLWPSSFVCHVCGLCRLLFALFYVVIGYWKIKKWTFFFVVIGMNSITTYLAGRVIDFGYGSRYLFNGFIVLFPPGWSEVLSAIAVFLTAWIFMYVLYKKKFFLKV